jgi:hypothetical protein
MIDWNLAAWCFALSSITTYVFWCWFRVWYFRQRLFMIRDDLWDQMYAKGMLDDPEHRAFRESINAMIRTAPSISLTSCLYLAVVNDQLLDTVIPMPQNDLIRKARERTLSLMVRYLLLESLTGLVLTLYLLSFGLWKSVTAKGQSVLGRIFDSKKLLTLIASEAERPKESRKVAHLH